MLDKEFLRWLYYEILGYRFIDCSPLPLNQGIGANLPEDVEDAGTLCAGGIGILPEKPVTGVDRPLTTW